MPKTQFFKLVINSVAMTNGMIARRHWAPHIQSSLEFSSINFMCLKHEFGVWSVCFWRYFCVHNYECTCGHKDINLHNCHFKINFMHSRHPPRKVNDYLFDISAISGPIFLKQTSPMFEIIHFTSVLVLIFIPAHKVVKSQSALFPTTDLPL